jgi:capsular polysaccharide transport system permease protein
MPSNIKLDRDRQAEKNKAVHPVRDMTDYDDDADERDEAPPRSNVELLLGRGSPVLAPVTRHVELPATTPGFAVEPTVRKRRALKLRHKTLVVSFLGLVLVPSACATAYMTLIAADQYSSSASFSVRSIAGSSNASDLMGIFGQASGSSSIADSFILMDYIGSADLLRQVEEKFDLESIYSRRGLDFYYSMGSGEPIENRLAFWRSVIGVSFDHSSGIITVDLKAFDPVDAKNLTDFIIARGEQLINDLSTKARDEVLRGSRQEVARAEMRLMSAREELRQYRNTSQEIDPTQGARVASDIVAGLESKLTDLNTSLNTARQQMSDDAPRIRVLKSEIASVKGQIQLEKQRLGTGSSASDGQAAEQSDKTSRFQDAASRLQIFEAVKTQEEFAQQAYASALGSLEKARMQAEEKQRYLGTFIRPSVSEEAQYPKRILNSFLVSLGFLFAWAASAMIYYNVRDRA